MCLAMYRYTSVNWHIDTLGLFVGIPCGRAELAIDWLLTRKYVWCPRDAYGLTHAGTEYVEGLRERTDIGTPSDERKWKDEALTGMTERGKRSRITFGVLPTVNMPHEYRTPEEMLLDKSRAMRAREDLANRLNVTLDRLNKLIFEGRIMICEKCGEPGIQDTGAGGRKYKTCRKCRRTAKKERNETP